MVRCKGKLIVLSTIIVLIAAVTSSAQNSVNWTGWYAGAYGGYLSGSVNSNDPAHEESTGDYDDDGPTAGLYAGYNRQYQNNWVIGAELFLPLYMQKGTATDKEYFPDSVFYEATYRYGVMVAVRGGRVIGKALPFVYAMVGITSVDGKTLNVDENDQYSPGFEQSAVATHMIWQFGGGSDYQVSERVFLGGRAAAFIGSKADHTMPWNEPGPNEFGYDGAIFQFFVGYRF